MRKGLRWKAILTVIIVVGAVILIYPPKDRILLGLDLQGGIHLVLQVITADAINIDTDQVISHLQEQFKKKDISYTTITKTKLGQFTIQGINSVQEENLRDILDDYSGNWDYSIFSERATMTMKSGYVQYLKDQSVNQAVETIRNRVDQFGVAEPTIQRQGLGGDRIIVELPGVENPERVKNIIKTTALLEWKMVKAGPSPDEETLLKDFGDKVPEDMEVVKGDPKRRAEGIYLLSRVATVTGKDISSVRRSMDDWNNPSVAFTLNSEGGRRFETVTAENIGKLMAIVLDGRVQSAPVIRDRIPGSGVIQGNFSVEEAEDLVLVLKSGALPASIKYLEERTIGPSLGADSIRKGLLASVVALLLVIGFMVIYYRLSGINAVVALILNIILLGGALAYFKAVLTLPGIAGVILTIGMAVDANVLIFERIREELAMGKSISTSISLGFKRAFSAIFDSNLTTIISAVFLFQFGTGPVKGYAITLIIGITASMFTAVFVSHLIFDLTVTGRKKIKKLSI
ncbi:MAG: protein translocase subunit SecD [Candidatus Aminicenantales bacterium]